MFCDFRNHCKRVLKDARSNYAETTRRYFAYQLIGVRHFWRICNSVLNRAKSAIPPLFNGPDVLSTSTDKAILFARNYSCNSTIDDGSQQLPDFPSRTENITAKMVSRAIYDLHPKPLATTESQPLSLRSVLQSFLMFLLSYTINAWPNLVFLHVGNFHRLCQFF